MLTEETIIFKKEQHNKEDYVVQAFVIDNEVVDVFAIPKTFLELYNNNRFVEKSLENKRYNINVMNNNDIIEEVSLPERIGAIFLSNPLMVELNAEKDNYRVVPGMKYVDGISWAT